MLYPGEVILEDRVYLTLGKRIRVCEELGYPVVVLVGHKVSVFSPSKIQGMTVRHSLGGASGHIRGFGLSLFPLQRKFCT
jgi:hypothetical protein